jgi:hypothetical protein
MMRLEDHPSGREAVEQHYRQIYRNLLAAGFPATFALDALAKAVVALAVNDVGLDTAWLFGFIRKLSDDRG